MLQQFKQHFESDFKELKDLKIGLAISGGLDSTVLAHLLYHLQLQVTFIHVNFKLRDQESDQDQLFVNDLAARWDIPCYLKQVDTVTYANDQKVSIQMAARDLRYDYFQELVVNGTVDVVFTAHHLDDQLETLLINLGRGTGLKGLTGIPQKSKYIYRPLLKFTREEILNYALNNDLKWRNDSSNESNKYVRNALRNKVIPLIKEEIPTLMDHLAPTLEYLKDSQSLVEVEISRFRESAITTKEHSAIIDLKKLKATTHPKAYLFEILRPTQLNVDEALKLIDASSGKQMISKTHQLVKDRDVFILKELKKSVSIYLVLNEIKNKTGFVDRTINMEVLDITNAQDAIKKHQDSYTLLLDASLVQFPMTLRNWKNGDRINPLGMSGYQKVSDVLINHKISLIEKENFLVLENKGELLWIAGLKTSNLYKITSNTKRMLKIWLTN